MILSWVSSFHVMIFRSDRSYILTFQLAHMVIQTEGMRYVVPNNRVMMEGGIWPLLIW